MNRKKIFAEILQYLQLSILSKGEPYYEKIIFNVTWRRTDACALLFACRMQQGLRRQNRNLRSQVNSVTGAYLGNTTNRSFTGGSGQFMNHNQKYREVRKGLGLEAG